MATIYKRLIDLGKVSGAITFLVAAPYAAIQYVQIREAARIEQTLSMFKQYNSAPFTTYREKITKALVKNKDKIIRGAASDDALQTVQFQIVTQEDVEMDLLLIFDFFDGVAVCVTTKVCDDDTAVKLFKPRALDIYVNFYQYMIAQRALAATAEFGIGLEAIAKSGIAVAPRR